MCTNIMWKTIVLFDYIDMKLWSLKLWKNTVLCFATAFSDRHWFAGLHVGLYAEERKYRSLNPWFSC